MNQMTPKLLEKARSVFLDNAGITLYHVRCQVAALPPSIRRRDALSALDSVSKLFNRDLAVVPANWLALRTLFRSLNAAQAGVSEKRYANIRSEVIKAVKTYGAGRPALTKRIALTPDWSELLATAPLKRYSHALNRLASFCSAMGIAPQKIDRQVLLALYEALVAEEVIKEPRKILRHTISHWNMCLSRVPGWPAFRLATPFPSAGYMLDLVDFPKSFQKDVAAWAERLLEVDLDGDGPETVLRPVTVASQQKLINGTLQVEQITSLATLASLPVLKAGLQLLLKRAGNKPTEYIRKYGWLLLSIAKHHSKLPDDEIDAIRSLVKRLGKNDKGMGARHKARLVQFEDVKNVRKMLTFPTKERERGLKVANPYRQAKFFERALSAALLISASVRMKNLHTIHMEKNIRFFRGECILTFEAAEVKNSRSLELVLPGTVTALLQEFVQKYRPRLPGADGPYLFPGRNGGPRSHNTMRQDFEGAVLKHTGLVVNPHLMRHFTAMVAISQDPANLTAVAQRLGHAGLQTCIDYYIGNESKPSSRVMNRILEEAMANPKGRG
jgi:integrase